MIIISDEEFKQLSRYIKINFGIDLTEKKKMLVVTRLQNILLQNGFSTFKAYYEHVVADTTGSAVTMLMNKITTNHTFFLREKEHFEFLKGSVLPYILKEHEKHKDLRIWSAGCSSGEEPYTLAMILADSMENGRSSWDTKILATDISEQVLTRAIQGRYSLDQLMGIPASWKMNYFKQVDKETFEVADFIKQEVIFRKFNLMNEDFPFKKKFHVIFCRNVMIYFDAPTKAALIQRFYEATELGGYLFIGHSESLIRTDTNYRYIMPAVYRKE